MKQAPEGFALIEAVVALAIVAAILGVTFQTVAMARSMLAAAEERRLATLEARSLAAELGANIPLVPGVSSGERDGMQWRVENEQVDTREISVPLVHSTISVSDNGNRPLARLETLRLAQ